MIDEQVEQLPALSEVRHGYEEAREQGDHRAAAEFAYALAIRLKWIGLFSEAEHFAAECLALAEVLPSATLDDVVSTRSSVGGVPLPDHFHDDVVRWRLSNLLDPAEAGRRL
jgi:hypothetical protein